VGFLMALLAKDDQILGSVIAQSTSGLNVMDLKIFHSSARLATPAVSHQDFAAELAISFRVKLQPRPLSADLVQRATLTSARSCSLCTFGRPNTSRVREGNKASRLPASKLTPARKSAQIISKQ
jgi:hypothetical protein